MFCRGFTCNDLKCKNKGAYGGAYCVKHLSQNITIKYYRQPALSFPFAGEIMRRVPKILNSTKELKKCLNNFITVSKKPGTSLYERRLICFAIFETLKRNIELCYDHERINKWSLKLADACIGHKKYFADYIEDFKMKCIKGYYENVKHQAKKKLVMFYFQHCEGLYYDVVEHIMTFY